MITKISMISNLILGIPPFCVGLLGDYSIRILQILLVHN